VIDIVVLPNAEGRMAYFKTASQAVTLRLRSSLRAVRRDKVTVERLGENKIGET
jgi:hypothetical protein